MADPCHYRMILAALDQPDAQAAWREFKAGITGLDLAAADLARQPLVRFDLAGANATATIFHGADLAGADLTAARLSYADLRQANLAGAMLRRANLTSASLRGANLTDACLERAKLHKTRLAGANLAGANLSAADLTGADLRGACLRYARLTEATLDGADIADADLTGAQIDRAACRVLLNPERATVAARRYRPPRLRRLPARQEPDERRALPNSETHPPSEMGDGMMSRQWINHDDRDIKMAVADHSLVAGGPPPPDDLSTDKPGNGAYHDIQTSMEPTPSASPRAARENPAMDRATNHRSLEILATGSADPTAANDATDRPPEPDPSRLHPTQIPIRPVEPDLTRAEISGQLLGVAPDAPLEEVVRAFRARARLFHPDMARHLEPKWQALATREFLRLRQAYETLTRRRPRPLDKLQWPAGLAPTPPPGGYSTEDYEQLARLNPANASILYNLACRYYETGRHLRAQALFERVIVIDPRDEDARYNLQMCRILTEIVQPNTRP